MPRRSSPATSSSSARRSASGSSPKTMNNAKGYVRGFDVRTGKRLWIFHTIPKPGEFGYDTWEDESALRNGNTGAWAQLSADLELGLVYVPVEMPTGDYYGGNRPGNTLFDESLVALDLKTGKRKWHYQTVHHGLWDYDLPCAPILFDMTRERPPRQGAGATDQAGVPVRAESRNRRADLADRGAAGAAVDGPGREDQPDAALPHQARPVRSAGHRRSTI